jgi:hypothetical protein
MNNHYNTKKFTLMDDIGMRQFNIHHEHIIISFSDSDQQRPDIAVDTKFNRGILRINLPRSQILDRKNFKDYIIPAAKSVLKFLEGSDSIEWVIIHSSNKYYRGPTTAAALSFIYNGSGSEDIWLLADEYHIDKRFFSAYVAEAMRMNIL